MENLTAFVRERCQHQRVKDYLLWGEGRRTTEFIGAGLTSFGFERRPTEEEIQKLKNNRQPMSEAVSAVITRRSEPSREREGTNTWRPRS